jgi:hypothetical protein
MGMSVGDGFECLAVDRLTTELAGIAESFLVG